MRRRLAIEWAFVAAGSLAVAAVLLLSWWRWGPVQMPFEVLGEPSAEYADGSVHVHRQWRVHARTTFQITRDLVRVAAPGAPRVQVTLPATVWTQEPGEYAVDRVFAVPEAAHPGLYDLVSHITWDANPIRRATVALPTVRVRITD